MVAYVIAGAVMLLSFVPLGMTAAKGSAMDGVVAYEAASSVAVLELIVLTEGFSRPGEFELPILLALLLFASGLVYVHALARYL
jgi:hypothetical protein